MLAPSNYIPKVYKTTRSLLTSQIQTMAKTMGNQFSFNYTSNPGLGIIIRNNGDNTWDSYEVDDVNGSKPLKVGVQLKDVVSNYLGNIKAYRDSKTQ
jgi:hypothetical protein